MSISFGAVGLVVFGWDGQSRWRSIRAVPRRPVGILLVVLAGLARPCGGCALLEMVIRPALTMLPHTAGLTMAAFLRRGRRSADRLALLGPRPDPAARGGLVLGRLGVPVTGAAALDPSVLVLLGRCDGCRAPGSRRRPRRAGSADPRPVALDSAERRAILPSPRPRSGRGSPPGVPSGFELPKASTIARFSVRSPFHRPKTRL